MRRRHAMPFGAEVADGGVRFAVWAPAARYAHVHVDERTMQMEAREDGFFVCETPHARAGSRYSFSFDREPLRVPDPASRFNPEDVHGPSEVIDPRQFEWADGAWRGAPWREAVIYELHVGTFTREGTYSAAAQRLDYLAELGITAVELMPLADTPGRFNWGYDGVLPFAPESSYGRPEDLKRFVQAAHERGVMVLLDVVYNHFGPDGNYLHLYAPQFFTDRHHTPWGKALNFDGEYSDVVRAFFVHNALYWLEEYHLDGLRLDAVHAILDDSSPDFLTELARRVERLDTGRSVHLVLENDRNCARYLGREENGKPALYTAQWNDDWHHSLHVLITGEQRGHYMDYPRPAEQFLRALLEGFVYQGEPSQYRQGRARGEPSRDMPPEAFVNFLQNHDQIGNRPDGKRLWTLISAPQIIAAETLLLLQPSPVLLFMGDEFHAPNPFPFFCDFTGDLGEAVTAGRLREFGKLADPAVRYEDLPGPNTPAARAAAVLDWSAATTGDHAITLERYRRLLAVRRAALGPRLPATARTGRTIGERGLVAQWRLADDAQLSVIANLSDSELVVTERPEGEVLAATADVAHGARSLPPWFVGWTLEH